MAKKWVVCTRCRYISECKTGLAKTKYIEKTAFMSTDTGCYSYDQYYNNFYENPQLKLFKVKELINI